jgi:hypothetical protein
VFFLVVTMLVCLTLSAAVALYVAFPARGRPLPTALTSGRPGLRRGATRRPAATRTRIRGSAQEVRS